MLESYVPGLATYVENDRGCGCVGAEHETAALELAAGVKFVDSRAGECGFPYEKADFDREAGELGKPL